MSLLTTFLLAPVSRVTIATRTMNFDHARLLSQSESRLGILRGRSSEGCARYDQAVACCNQPLNVLVARVPLFNPEGQIMISHAEIEHGSARNKRCFSVSKTCRNSCKFLHRSAFCSVVTKLHERENTAKYGLFLVLPVRIELTTSPLPRGCSTTELRQRRALL